jgi:uncharacterized protein
MRSASCSVRARIEQSLRRLETERVCDFRRAFRIDNGKPSHDMVRTWASGFWREIELGPADWHALAADDRPQAVIVPFVGFIDVGKDVDFEPAADIDNRLDIAAADIPQAILLLRKLAQLRDRRVNPVHQTPRTKIGRNDFCPCGSGKKLRYCGQSRGFEVGYNARVARSGHP